MCRGVFSHRACAGMSLPAQVVTELIACLCMASQPILGSGLCGFGRGPPPPCACLLARNEAHVPSHKIFLELTFGDY